MCVYIFDEEARYLENLEISIYYMYICACMCIYTYESKYLFIHKNIKKYQYRIFQISIFLLFQIDEKVKKKATNSKKSMKKQAKKQKKATAIKKAVIK